MDRTIEQWLRVAREHLAAGRIEQAEKIYYQLLADQPDLPSALHMSGVLALQTGRYETAADLIRRAVTFTPLWAEGHSNLGAALLQIGKFEEAVAAYRKAIQLKPDSPLFHFDLGTLLTSHWGGELIQGGRLDEAAAAFLEAIRLKPDFAAARASLARLHALQGLVDEAVVGYRELVQLKPDNATYHSGLIHTLNYHPATTPATMRQECLEWARRYADPLGNLRRPHENPPDPDRRLRIGYVSADFCSHASDLFILPLLAYHDHNQFDICCYAQVHRPDEMTRRMQAHATLWRSTVGLSEQQLAEQVRQDRIDVLIDLKLHSDGHRLQLFALKPAPVQVTWLGYPGTTGLDAIDYRLTDPYLDPPGVTDADYVETSLRLPHTFWCYGPSSLGPPVNPLPAQHTGQVTFGSLNVLCKLNPSVLEAWATILHVAANSRLLLSAPQGSCRKRMLEQLECLGVASTRVTFVDRLPRQQYLELYHRVDIALDSFPCNGHTTSLDALWMGVPVVSLLGRTVMGRAGFSQLSNLGLTELMGHDVAQYIQLATDLASDLDRLADLRASLRQRMQASPLMDAPRFARDMEALYRQIWRRWCQQHDTAQKAN
jgi:predicted O-linked N-acetylglucosamine transferase (SPINDLY family)